MDFETERFALTADICFGITPDIVTRLGQFQSKSFLLGHGYFDINIDAASSEKEFIAFYGGNLLIPYINRHMLLTLVRHHPEVRFVFVGSAGVGNLTTQVTEEDRFFLDNLKAHKNAQIMPHLTPEEYRTEMAKATVCLLVYDHENFADQAANSHKILEYLGAGKAVISFPIEAYDKNPLIITCSSEKEYENEFDKMVGNPEFAYNLTQINARKTFAKERSYSNRIIQIESLLNKHVQ